MPTTKTLNKLKVQELRQELEEAGLQTTGKKSKLVSRLLQHLNSKPKQSSAKATKYATLQEESEEEFDIPLSDHCHSPPISTTSSAFNLEQHRQRADALRAELEAIELEKKVIQEKTELLQLKNASMHNNIAKPNPTAIQILQHPQTNPIDSQTDLTDTPQNTPQGVPLLDIHTTPRRPVPRPRNSLQRTPIPQIRRRIPLTDTYSIQQDEPTQHHLPESNPITTKTELTELARAINASSALGRINMPEPTVFHGDPLTYQDWKHSFRILVENKGIPEEDKVFHLRKYLGTNARSCVEAFFNMTVTDGFSKAMNALDRRFGDPTIVVEAFKKKLNNWEKLNPKDKVGLLKMSDFLNQIQAAMSSVKGLAHLDNSSEIIKTASLLPERMIYRWERFAHEHKQRFEEYPSFEQLAKFVTTEAELINDPHSIPRTVSNNKRDKPPVRLAASHDVKATTTPKNPARCPLCNMNNHSLGTCGKFSRKSYAEKESFIKEKGLCYGCLNGNHVSKECPKRNTCEKCGKRHPTALHQDNFVMRNSTYEKKSAKEPEGSRARDSEPPNTASSLNSITNNKPQNISSMIIPVWVSDETSSQLVYALLDTQSDTTFITENVAARLQCTGQPALLRLSTMTDKDNLVNCTKYTGLSIRSFNSQSTVKISSCFTKEHIPMNYDHVPTPDTARAWPHLENIAELIPPPMNIEVGLLIGYDCSAALAPKNFIRGKGDEPYAIETELGWTIVGNTNPTEGITHHILSKKVQFATSQRTEVVHYVVRTAVKELSPYDAVKLLELDFNCNPANLEPISQKDLKFMKLQSEEIYQDADGFYTMPLPFKEPPLLHHNRTMALKRFNQIIKRMDRNQTFADDYKAFMNSILENKEAELVPKDKIQEQSAWYLPHHGVYHPRKPKKLRIVFDCSAEHLGSSLNSYLLTGPDLNNGLFGVLCRFRLGKVAIMCDIQRMYHQFRVAPEHRDFLRFLWIDERKTVKDYRMKVHIFGAASSPNCAKFGLQQIATDNEKMNAKAANFIKTGFYVDDGLTSVDTTQEAFDILKNTKDICSKGNLQLHKIISNDLEVMKSIDPEECLVNTSNMDIVKGALPIERALGVSWCIESDSFVYRLTLKDRPLTKRGVLATVASIYDPLGLIAPAILEGRRILQLVCQKGNSWDDPLSEDHRQRWERWRMDLHKLDQLSIPRCTVPKNFGSIEKRELHHFADASTHGYGECSYLRSTDIKGNNHCSLMMGKSRVLPTKVTTIPRLELQAATLAASTGRLLREELKDPNIKEYYWSDSKVVLSYIHNETRKFHVFVANRVEKIKECTKEDQWHYVPSSENPADHASRGLSPDEMNSSTWLYGPAFLKENPDKMILNKPPATDLDETDVEVRRCTSQKTNTHPIANNMSMLDFYRRFSDLKKAITGTSAIQQFLRCRTGSEKLSPVQARSHALTTIVKFLQEKEFSTEIMALQRNTNYTGSLSSLNPFIDEKGLLRVGGRLSRSTTLEYGVKHPMILPQRSHITMLVIRHFHEQVMHQGRGMTINQVRTNGYWIINCSSAVSSYIGKCVTCKRLRASPAQPMMANLPRDRVEPSAPFSYCGIDCFGPFLATDGRKEQKRYGLLITCLASRAVHIEMIDSMTTDSFINALRCVMSIRGFIKQLRCDKGTNFIGARNELSKAFEEVKLEKVKEYLLLNNTEFVFNPAHASNFGGVWERQIRSARSIMNVVLTHKVKLSSSSLRTILYEIMSIINSRPLSPVSLNDPTDSEMLTPNRLLTGKSAIVTQPPGDFDPEDMYSRKQWRKVQAIANEFWAKWRTAYLSNLQPRTKWKKKARNLQSGDIVILRDPSIVRSLWKMARVVDTNTDNDGVVRRIRLRVSNDSKPGTTELERPANGVVLLLETCS